MTASMETLERWFASVPQPSERIDWLEVERDIGAILPSDYKRFCDRFPPNAIQRLSFSYPFDVPLGRRLRDGPARIAAAMTLVEGEIAGDPWWPWPDQLLIWGGMDGMPLFCWDTSSSVSPDEWRSVIFDISEPAFEVVNLTMTGCVVSLVNGDLDLALVDAAEFTNRPLLMALGTGQVPAAL